MMFASRLLATRPVTSNQKLLSRRLHLDRSVHRFRQCRRSAPSPTLQAEYNHRRCFSMSSIISILTPPAVFAGLVVTLWAYKCLMMIVFQNSIIYMANLPPGARSERIETYQHRCGQVQWREQKIKSLDGTVISLCVGELRRHQRTSQIVNRHVVIVYFQGFVLPQEYFTDVNSNGSSLPPRLPALSRVLTLTAAQAEGNADWTMVALSYRGYWTSRGRPSEAGIKLDAMAAIDFAQGLQPPATIVLWGQSIGAGVASYAASEAIESGSSRIAGILLETPFTSLREMLTAIYPQKWLPYRYLWPFLSSRWDSRETLFKLANSGVSLPPVLVLNAGSDEVVPKTLAKELAQTLRTHGYDHKIISVPSALHHETITKSEGVHAAAVFLRRCAVYK